MDTKENVIEAKGDSTSTRSFTIDQRIDIENLGLQNESMMDRKHKVTIVALSLEESAMTKMIDAGEGRAMQRCPEYDSSNQYWVKIDNMLKDQDKLMDKIRTFNKGIMNQKPSISLVSDFLNNASPTKKRKAIEVDEMNSNDVDDDMSDTSGNAVTVTKVSQI